MELSKIMTNILNSENLQSKVERYKQRLSQALRTAENRFYNGLKQQKAGGIWDEDTKLICFGVRDYDPEVGRWTSVEPLGFSGSRNWYVYAGNDPIGKIDLDGRAWWCKRPLKTFDEQHGELSHEYLCTSDGTCRGLTTDNLWRALLYMWSKGHLTRPGEDKLKKEPNDEEITCYEIDTRSCMDRCLKDVFKHEYMSEEYHLYMYNCHDWAYDAYNYCSVNCSYY